ncbi:hypothetical protein FHW88_004912 [Mucilaginibacter sp. SG538B]|uniref:hypothetical protein n=1 Tax=Mucilaginibacter sp. SG538B TaxID=2587021 RepID=UPI00159E9C19|nr:hypothetical protein [Mucilaginibacter sp. SG538B]NVM66594.1 hypothetical protein [Mucilaginibacter sp. SG538B]
MPCYNQQPGQPALYPVKSFSLFFANPAGQPLLGTALTIFTILAGPAWVLSLAGSEAAIGGLDS